MTWLSDPTITEIAVNRPGEVWFEANNRWMCATVDRLTFAHLESMATAVAAYTKNNIDAVTPILSAVLPDGERVQFVRPPACEANTISLTIRKPSKAVRTLDDYQTDGYFSHIRPLTGSVSPADKKLLDLLDDNDLQRFFELAVLLEKIS
ncbi:ATPase, T2SS/T4P/T4SS family [Plesiomonas shigelloides subsp. oncorhynchi]|nr:ATPase, T2SS/T4P/T4SS family [Plesiomonas shigelloides]